MSVLYIYRQTEKGKKIFIYQIQDVNIANIFVTYRVFQKLRFSLKSMSNLQYFDIYC